jgi:hypothetical protein
VLFRSGFRRAVPADGLGGEDLLERLRERLDPDDVARRMRLRLVGMQRPVLDGQLTQLRALASLRIDTAVERRPTVIADVEADGEGVVLRFEGKELRFPAFVLADVELCATAEEPFRPADLPGELDEEGRLVLVRRLVREGFLRLTDARRADS